MMAVIWQFGNGMKWVEARAGGRAGRGMPEATKVELPDIEQYLGPDGHVRLDPDVQAMEGLTGGLAPIIRDLLIKGGMDEATARDMPWGITDPAHIAAPAGGPRLGAPRHTLPKTGTLGPGRR